MQITAMYDVGATVWMLVTRFVTTPVACDTCGSTGKVTISGEEFTCPNCAGQRVTGTEKETIAQSVEIKRLLVKKTVDGTQIRYEGVRNGRGGVVISEGNVFATKAAAEAAIPAP